MKVSILNNSFFIESLFGAVCLLIIQPGCFLLLAVQRPFCLFYLQQTPFLKCVEHKADSFPNTKYGQTECNFLVRFRLSYNIPSLSLHIRLQQFVIFRLPAAKLNKSLRSNLLS